MRSVKRAVTVLALLALCLTLMAVSAFAAEDTVTVRAKVPSDWETAYLYCWNSGSDVYASWPGSPMTQDGDWWSFEMPAGYGNIIVAESSGGEQTYDISIDTGRDVWVVLGEYDGNKYPATVCYEDPSVSVVASGTCGDALTWTLDSEGTLTISGSGEMYVYYNYEYDATLLAPWDDYRDDITSVVISDGVTGIGDGAFAYCESLTSVTIPNSVTSIGGDAFSSCSSLASVTIPDSVTSIGRYVFSYCSSLTSVTIPDSVTSIGGGVFSYCSSLTSVTIPDSVTSIGGGVFFHCDSLASVTIPNSVTDIGKRAFYGCTGLTSVTIPNSVTDIGEQAFYGCTGLTAVTVPNSVTSIGADAFKDCPGLADEDGFVIFRNILFDYTGSDIYVTIPDGVTRIDSAFAFNRELQYVTIPNSVTVIGDSAFRNCLWLSEVTIPSGVTSIGAFAFKECSRALTEVTIPASVTSIGESAFQYCWNMVSVTISEGVTSIGDKAFWNCYRLESVTIPNSVTSIGREAFYGCTGLTSVEILGNGVAIGDHAFEGCDGLADENGFVIVKNVLYGYIGGPTAVIPTSVTSIGPSAFSECSDLISVTVPSSVTAIGRWAFSYCHNLTTVVLPDNGVVIGDGAFNNCEGLADENGFVIVRNVLYGYFGNAETAVVPVGVTRISCYAFDSWYNNQTTAVILPWGVTSIAYSAFEECNRLTSITIPRSVTSIGADAFYWCDVTDVYYTGTESQWAEISIGDENRGLSRATIHYNYVPTLATPAITKLENTASGIKISWGAVFAAEKYRVYVKTSTGWQTIGTTTGTSLTYTGAKSGSAYTFTVRCLNGEGTAFTSSFNATGWKQTYVAQPSISKLENTASGVKVTWGAVSGAGQYRVFVKTSRGWATVGTTTGASLTYTGAKSGYTYTFTVRALNSAGTAFVSSYNTTGWKQTYVAQPAISKFENTASGIKVTWNAVAGAGKYRVYVKTSSGWATVGTTTGTSLTYTGAKSGYTYTFTVRALNSAGTAFVSSYNTTGWKQTYVAQPAISKLENTASGIKVTWGAVNGAAKYRVFVKTSSGWAAVGTTTGTSLTYTGAKSGYTYTFTVRALNSAGTAFVSSYNSTGWKQTYVAQPSITKLTNTTSGISITWGAVNGAAKYRVFVKTSSGWKAIGTTTGTSLTWTGAASGVTYTFTVRCLNSAGTAYTSAFSSTGWSIKRT